MIKVDLITGFLGSGKTTFIKEYAQYLIDSGLNIGILENDFGAVNVDMMLLTHLEGKNCDLEMIAGGCDKDCHIRRFKTKLIAMGMLGYDRVIIEPSGIFDVDEFFDILHEEPLDRWYEIGSVIAIVDGSLGASPESGNAEDANAGPESGNAEDMNICEKSVDDKSLSVKSRYLLATQLACSGKVIFSRTQDISSEIIEKTKILINAILSEFGSDRILDREICTVDWNSLASTDFEGFMKAGYKTSPIEKLWFDEKDEFKSLYFMDMDFNRVQIEKIAESLFCDKCYGNIIRIKGFIKSEDNGWLEVNATCESIELEPIETGQKVVIVIGAKLNEESINALVYETVDVGV